MSVDIASLFAEREAERFTLHSRHLNEQMVRVLRTIGFDVGFTSGRGQYLYDRDGKRYLDMLSGWGVFALGRNHPGVRDVLKGVLDADLPNLIQMDVSVLAGILAERLLTRVPYLDRRFVEHCARLPPGWKRHGEVGKYLFKKIAERYLPRDLVHRRKQGFTLPLSEWFAGALRKESESALSGFAKRGLIRPEHIRTLLRRQRRGSRNRTGKLWTLLILEKWFQRYAPEYELS